MFFDNHIHIASLYNYKKLSQELIEQNYFFVAVGSNPSEWPLLWDLWQNLELKKHNCNLCLGIHPNTTFLEITNKLKELKFYLEKESCFLVGEIGLDKRFPLYGKDEFQEQLFKEQAKLAFEMNRDVQIHCVGDYQRIIRILQDIGFNRNSSCKPIFHRFGGDESVLKQIQKIGGCISIHQNSLKKKSTMKALKKISITPFFETDADENMSFRELSVKNMAFELRKIIEKTQCDFYCPING